MSNEIKQGDKVRVSKDAPRIYTPDWVDAMFNLVLKVTEVEDGNAMVEFEKRTSYRTVLTAIPCKYLVKVDAEAKEPKIDVGDEIRIKVGSLTLQGVLLMVSGDIITIMGNGEQITSWRLGQIDHMELIEKKKQQLPKFNRPQAKPTEKTEAEKTDSDNFKKTAEEWANTVSKAIKEYGDAAVR